MFTTTTTTTTYLDSEKGQSALVQKSDAEYDECNDDDDQVHGEPLFDGGAPKKMHFWV